MLSRYVALVSETKQIDMADLAALAGAIQKQVTRDFGPIWGIQASVAAFGRLEDVPLDYWPVVVTEDMDRAGAAGYHDDPLGEPCARVLLTDQWTSTVSHELLEMLADPWGRKLVAGPWPGQPERRVKFLLEVCDPCSDSAYNYKVNGIDVSDFYTPHFFDPVAAPGVRYSFTGAIKAPREILPGGYMTWHDHAKDQWWHRTRFDGGDPSDVPVDIPSIVRNNIRAEIDRHAHELRRRTKTGDAPQLTKPPRLPEPEPSFISRAAAIRTALGLQT